MRRTMGVSLETSLALPTLRRLSAATSDMALLGSRRKGKPGALHPMTGEQVAERMSAVSRIDVHKERLSGDGGVEEPSSGVSGTIAAGSRIAVQAEDTRGAAAVRASNALTTVEKV